jgi:hypothetical protein
LVSVSVPNFHVPILFVPYKNNSGMELFIWMYLTMRR